jgi:hypothetical protein
VLLPYEGSKIEGLVILPPGGATMPGECRLIPADLKPHTELCQRSPAEASAMEFVSAVGGAGLKKPHQLNILMPILELPPHLCQKWSKLSDSERESLAEIFEKYAQGLRAPQLWTCGTNAFHAPLFPRAWLN